MFFHSLVQNILILIAETYFNINFPIQFIIIDYLVEEIMSQDNLGSGKGLNAQKKTKHKHKQKKEQQNKIVHFFQLYRFAEGSDKILLLVGIVMAFATGCGFPFFGYIWGKVTDAYRPSNTPQMTVDESAHYRDVFLLIGAGTLIAGWISFTCWIVVGQRMALKCRKAYLKSLLSQQMGFFDTTSQYKISSQFQSDTILYQRAIGQKVGSLIMIGAMFICGASIAFAVRWTLTLIIFCAMPFLGIAGFLFIYLIELKNINFLKFYGKAGSRAQQAITAIKTVKMLNGQQHQYNLYQKSLKYIAKRVPKYSLYGGIGDGLFYIAQFFAYAWAFWYGSHCAQDTNVCPVSATGSRYTAGQVVSVFFALFVGSYNFMQLVPSIQKIYGGMLAAYRLYQVIDREPVVKSPQKGKKIQNMKGLIKFQNVTFSYPKDKSSAILRNLNLQLNIQSLTYINFQGQQKAIKGGCCGPSYTADKNYSQQSNGIKQTKHFSQANSNALVGESGCGKSTILQLIMRFYDPDEGRILIDGVDLRDLDLHWYRNQIGYVGQEPVLFATSIKENIKYGKPDASDEEILDALKKAEAYDFVMTLQQKQNTYVGYGGGQLSGGQKQRIAIARAIIRNPSIYILDEATSALDRKNQKLIQKTLDSLVEDRTSITVAHRVNTIMNSNRIYVLDKGKLVQEGRFQDLQRFKGIKKQKKQKASSSKIKLENNKQNDSSDDSDHQQIKQQQNQHDAFKVGQQPRIEDQNLSRQQTIQKQQEQIRKSYSKGIYSKLFSYTRGQRIKLFIGSICACAAGAAYPVFTIFLAKIVIGTFQLYVNPNDAYARQKCNRNALIITLMGIAVFFLNLLEYYLFSVAGQKVTERIRLQAYHKILRMPIPWFDIPRNSGSAVAGRLSIDSQLVNGLTSLLIAVMLHNLATIIAAFIISFIYCWRIGIVGLVAMPLMLLAGFISMLFYGGFGDKSQQVYKQSSRLVSESIMNIKTVKALAYENILTQRYDSFLVQPQKFAFKKGNIIGALYGLSQFFIFFCFAFLFWIGSLVKRDNDGVQVIDIFTAIYAIVWAGWTAGNNFFFMPDIAQGQKAAANLFYILDRKDEQQCQMIQGSQLLKSGIRGNIRFENVSFRYASRNQYVFKNINLEIKEGDKIAFVGPSGCGKSTIINLVLRFYCQSKGNIIIDGKDIKQYDINYLRSCFGVVGQQPVLFNASFMQNIKYNTQQADQQDIKTAAKKANAISFILGDQAKKQQKQQYSQKQQVFSEDEQQQKRNCTGFDKNVGARGSHISGGQKQRVAIARAILKNPQILLLDEATSALDSINEKIVQQSLDEIMVGKTSINIAHRIETIKNSKLIFVFNKGKIVQRGSYKQLVNNQSYFYMLQKGISF